jgi:peptidoglycan biosynthesis protein MviN/MurJ (putative lipid II flippase)
MSESRSIRKMTVLNFVGALVGLINSVVITRFFGVSRDIEIYFAAVGMQAALTALMQTGQLSEAFLPVYLSIRAEQGKDAAQTAFSIILNWVLIAATLAGLLACLLASVLMQLRVPGFAEADILRATDLFRAIIPIIVMQVASNLLITLANAERRFGSPEAISVGVRILSTLFIVALMPWIGIWALVGSLWLGIGCGVIGHYAVAMKGGFRYRFVLKMPGFSASSLFSNVFFTLGYASVTQIYSIALDAALSACDPGVFAVVRYVQMLYSKVDGILMRPVSTVYFSTFANDLAAGAKKLPELSRVALQRMLFITAVVSTLSWSVGEASLSFLWGSNRFLPEHVGLAALLLSLMLTTGLVQGWALIWRKTAVSVGLLRAVYIFGMVANGISAIIVHFVVPQAGTIWIALVVVSAPVLLQVFASLPLAVWRREFCTWYSWGALLKWTICISVSVLLVRLAELDFVFQQHFSGRVASSLTALCNSMLAVCLLFLTGWIARIPEARSIVGSMNRRWFARIADPL